MRMLVLGLGLLFLLFGWNEANAACGGPGPSMSHRTADPKWSVRCLLRRDGRFICVRIHGVPPRRCPSP